jgi:O-antigen ligase
LMRFSCKVMIVVVAIATLDTLTQTLFTYETVKRLTGFANPLLDGALADHAEAVFRNDMIRAQGPLGHSILFGAVCAWFSTLAIGTFRKGFFAKYIAVIALFGIIISGSRAPLPAYAAGFLLLIVDVAASWFRARWRALGLLVALYLFVVFTFSGNPISTLLRYTGIDPEAAYYRELIWQTVVPMVMGSPVFGLGLYAQLTLFNTDLVGTSVDSLWLQTSMLIGIPGAFLIFLTMVGAFWKGALDKCPYLSKQEQQLSMALGFVIATIVYIGFTVHLFGACAILIGIFPGMRANLAEAAILRARAASYEFRRYLGRADAPAATS